MWKECGKLLISVDNSKLLSQRDANKEGASFSEGAFGFNCAFVGIYHRFYITKAKPETFYVVYIAGMGPEEFFEYPA